MLKKNIYEDPIEKYLDNFSWTDLQSEEEKSSSVIFDILFGFLFHSLFILIFGIFNYQNENTINTKCHSENSKYFTIMLIYYHIIGAFCCLIIIPSSFYLKQYFFNFNTMINNFILFLRLILTTASFFIFFLIWSQYEWKKECQILNDLLYIYIILCMTTYGVLILLGSCIFLMNIFLNNKKAENLSNSNILV